MQKLVQQLLKQGSRQSSRLFQANQSQVCLNRFILQKFSSVNNNDDHNGKQFKEKNKHQERKEKNQSLFDAAESELEESHIQSIEEMIEEDFEQNSQFNVVDNEEFADNAESLEEEEGVNKAKDQKDNKQSTNETEQEQEEEESNKIDPSQLNEFDRKFYDFFTNNKVKALSTLSQEELNNIGEEYNNLIDSLLENNLDELYQYINECQLLAFRLYADWINAMQVKKFIDQHDPVIQRNMTFLQEHLLTFLSPTPSKHPKQYFSCIHNYAVKVFTPIQSEMIIPIIKKNLSNISIVELSKFGVLFQKNKDFLKQIVSEMMRKFPKATILEFSYAQSLFKIQDIQQNFVFTDQYLRFYSQHWQKLNIFQVMGLSRILVYFKESDFNKYFYLFDEVVRRNMGKFRINQLKALRRFYHILQKQAKTIYQNPITYDVDKRLVALQIKRAMFNIEKQQPKGTKPLIPRSVLTKIKEYVIIAKEIEYFKGCKGLPKSQADKIIEEIIQKNPQFETLKNDIMGQQIYSFITYSSLLKQLSIKDKKVIIAMSQQYEQQYRSIEQTIDQEIIVFQNFQSLGLYYPFMKEIQEKLLENFETYDFSSFGKSKLAYELICYCSLYVPNLELIEKVEKKLLENFINQIYKEPSNILKLALYLPPNTFKEFVNKLIHLPEVSFVKHSYYRYIVTLTKQGKVDPQLFMANQQAVSLFKQSQQLFYKYMKLSGQTQLYNFMDQELIVLLNTLSQRYFSDKNLKIVAKYHCIENQNIKFLVQSSEKTLHINLIPRQDLFMNEQDQLVHNEQFKSIHLKQYVNYEYITFLDFCTQDREKIVKKLLTKYFRD